MVVTCHHDHASQRPLPCRPVPGAVGGATRSGASRADAYAALHADRTLAAAQGDGGARNYIPTSLARIERRGIGELPFYALPQDVLG
jgi:hypothetical protein